MIINLHKLYRLSLLNNVKSPQTVELRKTLGWLKLSFLWMKIRYGKKLFTHFNIDSDVWHSTIPQGVLQRLVSQIVSNNYKSKKRPIVIELFNDYKYLYINYYSFTQTRETINQILKSALREYQHFPHHKPKVTLENDWCLIQIPFVSN